MNWARDKRNLILWRLLFVLLSVLLALFPVSTHGAEKPGQTLKKIRIVYSSISGNMAPLWVTYEMGFFSRYGLDVELVLVEGGSRAAQTLVSGDAALAQMARAAVIQTNVKSADLLMISGTTYTSRY